MSGFLKFTLTVTAIAVGAAVSVGIGIAVWYYIRKNKSQIEVLETEELKLQELGEWFKLNEEELKKYPENIFVLLDSNIVEGSPNIKGNVREIFSKSQKSHMLAQAIYRQSDSSIIKCRVVMCNSFSDNTKDLFERTDFMNKKIVIISGNNESKEI